MLNRRFREINSNTREGRASRMARFIGDRGCKDESRSECRQGLVVVCGRRRLPLLPTPGKRGPCPVEATGLEQRPECQDALAAVTPPVLSGPKAASAATFKCRSEWKPCRIRHGFHAFDCLDRATSGFSAQNHARADHAAIHDRTASATIARSAAFLGARQAETGTQTSSRVSSARHRNSVSSPLIVADTAIVDFNSPCARVGD